MSDNLNYKVPPPQRYSQGESCMVRTGKAMMQGAFAGIFVGSGILAWHPDPYVMAHKETVKSRALGLRYYLGGLRAPVGWMTVACGTFGAVECLVENMRNSGNESTYVNSAIAGAVSGAVAASMYRRMDIMASTGLLTGLICAIMDYNGRTFTSDKHHANIKWENRFTPHPEESTTVAELKKQYPEYKDL